MPHYRKPPIQHRDVSDVTYKEGVRAAAEGRPYSENPYPQDKFPRMRLLWSKGHNAERARMIQRREVSRMRGQK